MKPGGFGTQQYGAKPGGFGGGFGGSTGGFGAGGAGRGGFGTQGGAGFGGQQQGGYAASSPGFGAARTGFGAGGGYGQQSPGRFGTSPGGTAFGGGGGGGGGGAGAGGFGAGRGGFASTPGGAFGAGAGGLATPAKPAFGSGGGYGQSSGGFGQSTGGGFGSGSKAGFGTGAGASMGANIVGTKQVKFQPVKAGSATEPAYIHSISAMNEYRGKSFEELRMEDYQNGIRPGQTGGMGGGFGAKPAFGAGAGAGFGSPKTTGFGAGGAGAGGFGSTGGFGAASTPGGFGAKPGGFGTSGGGFGAAGSSPGFGSKPGGFGAGATGGGFGAGSTGGFGAGGGGFGAKPGGFGSTGGFGAGGSSPGGFGAKAGGFGTGGGFGQKPGGFGQGAGGFGQQAQGGGFGQQSQGGFGATGGGFGAKPGGFGSGGGFGSTPGGGGFGAAGGTGGFGGGAGGFGAKTGGFGGSSPGFGNKTGGFGAGTGGFGMKPPGSGGFGAAGGTSGGGFGTGGFGAKTGGFGGFGAGATGGTGNGTGFGGFGGGFGQGQGGFGAQNAAQVYQQQAPAPTLPIDTHALESTKQKLEGLQAKQSALEESLKRTGPLSVGPEAGLAATSAVPETMARYRHAPRAITMIRPRGFASAAQPARRAGERAVTPSESSFNPDVLLGRSTRRLIIEPKEPVELPKFRREPPKSPISTDQPTAQREQRTANGRTVSPPADEPSTPVADEEEPTRPTASPVRVITPKPQRPSATPRPPVLTKPGYITEPAISYLERMTDQELASVANFKVIRDGYGEIQWEGRTDVRGLNLDELVFIDQKTVDVYPNVPQDKKPPLGYGLNKSAKIILYNVQPKKRDTSALMEFEAKLSRACEENDDEHISWEAETGRWIFRASHFSRKGLVDEDESDDEQENRPRPQGQTTPQQLASTLQSPDHTVPKRLFVNPSPLVDFAGSGSGLGRTKTVATPVEQRMAGVEEEDVEAEAEAEAEDDAEDEETDMFESGADMAGEPEHVSMDFSAGAAHWRYNSQRRAVFQNAGLFPRAQQPSRPVVKSAFPPAPLEPMHVDKTKFAPQPAKAEPRPQRAFLPDQDSFVQQMFSQQAEQTKQRVGAAKHVPANMSRMMGRTFRVGWGPQGQIAHAGRLSGLQPAAQHANLSAFGDRHRVVVEHVPVRPCTPGQARRSESELDAKILRHALNFSTSRVDSSCPKWEFPSALDDEHDGVGTGSYIRFVRCLHAWSGLQSASLDPRDPNWTLRQTLMLVNALVGQEERWLTAVQRGEQSARLPFVDDLKSGDTNSLTLQDRRFNLFSEWLKQLAAQQINDAHHLPANADKDAVYEKVFELLTAHKLDEAADVCEQHGALRLAMLIMQAGSDSFFQDQLAAQLENWDAEGCLTLVPPNLLRIYKLLSGRFDEHGELDWMRSLAISYWYRPLNDDDSLQHVVGDYDYAQLNRERPFPRVAYAQRTQWRSALYETLRLLSQLSSQHDELTQAAVLDTLLPGGFTPNTLDYRFSWVQFQLLQALGLCPEENQALQAAGAIITQHFVSQLLAEGQWEWAVYVALHARDPNARQAFVREVINRFAPSTRGAVAAAAAPFLTQELKIPAKWVHEAAAWRAGYEFDLLKELELKSKAKRWSEVHDLVISRLAPQGVLQGGEALQAVHKYLQQLAMHAQHIRHWQARGAVFLDYIILTNTEEPADPLRVQSLQRRLAQFADETAAVVRSRRADVGKEPHKDLHVLQLVALQEMRTVLSDLLATSKPGSQQGYASDSSEYLGEHNLMLHDARVRALDEACYEMLRSVCA